MANATPTEVGAVVSLWRYPVKSMLGEELQTAQVRDHGLLGDRVYALLDRSDGRIATAKNPRICGRCLDRAYAGHRGRAAPAHHESLRSLCDDHLSSGRVPEG